MKLAHSNKPVIRRDKQQATARLLSVTIFLVLVSGVPTLRAQQTARVGDITRLQGQGKNLFVGYGLVTGLPGTGDGSKFIPTMRALGATLQRFGANIESLEDVEASKNTAVVMVEVTVPEHGAREGDSIDASVTALAAKSLNGGRLLSTPLIYHDRSVNGLYGFAQGPLVVDGSTPTAAVIRGGARMERDVFIHVVASGLELHQVGVANAWIQPNNRYITLVLDDAHAGWSMAAAVAQALDKELTLSADVDRVALAVDAKNVVVLLPEHQLGDPASWIRDVQQTPILVDADAARVTINRRTQTIVVTGDTRISPAVVSQAGLTVTVVNPLPEGTVPRPSLERQDFVPMDIENQRTPNVRDLLEALNRLKVPFKDRVSILEELSRAGKLHAKLMFEG